MRIHLVAVAGTGMGALAGLLQQLGHEVSGSDVVFHPPMGPALKAWGIRCLEGFDPAHLEPAPDRVVIGNVCRRDNAQAVAAFERGLDVMHIASALQEFVLDGTSPLVVAGTHGKTTTTALAAYLLDRTGFEPGFLVGGLPLDFEKSARPARKRVVSLPIQGAAGAARAPRGAGHATRTAEPAMATRGLTSSATPAHGHTSHADAAEIAGAQRRDGGWSRRTPFVIEGDEYDTAFFEKTAKFLHYRADVCILTSIEQDHIDIYPTFAEYRRAFEQFIAKVPESGLIVAYAGDPAVVEVVREHARAQVTWYALDSDDPHGVAVHWLGAPAPNRGDLNEFDLYAGGVFAGRFSLGLPGKHNLRNALAALAAAAEGYGAPLDRLRGALPQFQGVARRQQVIGSPRSITVIDDFAHHPTAVRETLAALRARYRSGKLWAVFEPRSATACRKLHQQQYPLAFDAADVVLFAPLGRQNLAPEERLDIEQIASALRVRGRQAEALPSIESILERLTNEAKPGDLIALLSNGNFGGIHEQLLARLAAE